MCLIVLPDQSKQGRVAVGRLRECGFDSIDIFAPRGVPLVDSDNVVRYRCKADATESDLYMEAIRAVHGNFVRDYDFVLYIRADVKLWGDAKLLMEHTIEPNFVAAYFPYTPSPFLLASDLHLSCAGRNAFGWCAVQVDQPVSGAGCWACNKHTAMLLAGAIPWLAERGKLAPTWPQNHMMLLRSLEMTSYAHTPSLAISQEPFRGEQVRFEARLPTSFTEKKLYLN